MAEMDNDQNGVMQDFLMDDFSSMFPPGTSEEEIAALYSDPELFERYIQDLQIHYNQMQKNYSVYNECAVPVVTQSFHQMWQILLYCFILRCLWKLNISHYIIHCVTIGLGFISMWKFYGQQMLHIMLPSLFFLPLFQVRHIYKGSVVCFFATAYLVACEFFLLDSVDWNKVKGSVMVVMMKSISVIFDVENGVPEVPLNQLQFYSYVFHPASIIFGPFMTYKNYMQVFHAYPLDMTWWIYCVRSVLLSVICLLWSSCGVSNYLPKLASYVPFLEENKWWMAYQEAQSFRFSHYFICYFSEASCLVSGIGTVTPIELNKKKENVPKLPEGKDNEVTGLVEDITDEPSRTWSFPVANLLPVELPGSLVDVVTNWNLPMHYWLKNYVFKATRVYGVLVAIFATYISSSILHGMNFQLSAVLLSIGIFAYVESATRSLLADTFDACIEARPCKENCGHTYQRKTFLVMAVNLLFSFIAVWNLAYLGCLFDSSSEEESGYSMTHAHEKWLKYSYLNHWVMLVMFLLQGIIKTGRFI